MKEQHNNHQQKDVLTIYNEAAKAVTNEDYKSVSGTPAQTGKKLPLAVEQFVPSRRTRINRLIIRRRLHERYHRDIVPRLVIGTIIFFTLLISLSSSGVGAAYAYYQAQLPLLNGVADHSLFQSTHIYDRNGHLLYELYDHQDGHGRRTYVNYSDISPLLIQATVAAEDHSFWQNNGVDLQGTIRAAVANLQHQTVIEGGSTITQQLVKNQLFLTDPRTIQIKSEEAILAYGLTQQYPKWKIMEMYLNTVYYGDLNYGVEAAAQNYFRLQPKCTRTHCAPAASQLDLAQASLLAGLPKSPSELDPVVNKPGALDRQKQVLDSMLSLGMITKEEEIQAEKEMAKYTFKPFTHGIQAPHFVHYIIDQVLVPLLGAQNLLDGGYNIYTTLDLNLEKKVEQITHDKLYKQQYDSYLGTYGPLN